MIGGMVLHGGNIAEMVTGEGKTLVATLPAYLNALEGKGVHVVTVNDYLARRDMEWMGPLYMGLGLTVGDIQSGMEAGERQKAYACDITYGTNNEFGFDYLRDNMRPAARGDDRYPEAHAAGAGPAALRDHRRSRQHPDRRSPHAADHLRPGRTTTSPGTAKADKIARQLKKDVALRGQGEGAHGAPDRRRRARGRAAGRRRELLHGRQHGVAAPDRQLAQGPSPLQARRELRRRGRRGDHRRRVHRPPDAGPQLERRLAPGGRGQGRRARSRKRTRRWPRSRCKTSSSCTTRSAA